MSDLTFKRIEKGHTSLNMNKKDKNRITVTLAQIDQVGF